jgi:hypothetical protein
MMAVVLALLATAFIGVLIQLNRMLYGTPSSGVFVGEAAGWPLLPLALFLAALALLGVFVPGPVERLVERIPEIVGT